MSEAPGWLMLGGDEETVRYQAQGWTVLDGNPHCGADIIATVPPLPDEVTARQWQEVCAIHFIEHFYQEDARKLIAQIYDILAPNGRLTLEQPNLEWVCKAILGQVDIPRHYPWMKGERGWCTTWVLYPQPHMTKGNTLQAHRYQYTPDTLTELVKACGFSSVVTGRARSHVPERDFRLEAVKT